MDYGTASLTHLAVMTIALVIMGTLLLMAVAIFRRWQQVRYARYLHSLRKRYRPILAESLRGTCTAAGIVALQELPRSDLELLIDPLFSKRKVPESHLVFLQSLCGQLGLTQLWQYRLVTGEEPPYQPASPSGAPRRLSARPLLSFLLRAKSIRNLGILRHRSSWPHLVKALDDPHPDIQSVALRALAAIRAHESFPAILERLTTVALGGPASLSLRALRTALISFDLGCSAALVPPLRHPYPPIRALGADILREMVRREAARVPDFFLRPEDSSPELIELILSDLCRDASAEVRGRVAEVLAYLSDARATAVLHELLFDPEWYVRLRAVRGLASPRHASALAGVRACLRDPHWRVREAAIRTLIALGPLGRKELYECFLTTQDPILRDQLVVEIERTGLMASLINDYGHGRGGVEALAMEHLASQVAPRGFLEALLVSDPTVRQEFLQRFLPYVHFIMRLEEGAPTDAPIRHHLQQTLEFPPLRAA